jgi:hypothetical protein
MRGERDLAMSAHAGRLENPIRRPVLRDVAITERLTRSGLI